MKASLVSSAEKLFNTVRALSRFNNEQKEKEEKRMEFWGILFVFVQPMNVFLPVLPTALAPLL